MVSILSASFKNAWTWFEVRRREGINASIFLELRRTASIGTHGLVFVIS